MTRWGIKYSRIGVLCLTLGAPLASYAAGPSITSLTPNSGNVGTSVTIAGSGFGSSQGSSAVTFNGLKVTSISTWSTSKIVATAPVGATTGNVVVTVGGTASNGVLFTVTPKIVYAYDEVGRLLAATDTSGNTATYTYDAAGNILSISQYASTNLSLISFTPSSGGTGTNVTIYGTGFSPTPSQNSVTFNGINATVSSSTATQIVTSVPSSATTGLIAVTVNSKTVQSSKAFVVGQAPTISSFTPSSVDRGTSVSITGTNFQPQAGYDQARFNSFSGQVQSATATNISALVPGVGSGHVSVATPFGSTTSSSDLYIPPQGYTAAMISPVGTGSGRISLGTATNASVGVGQVGLLLFDGSAGQKVSATLSNGTFPSCSANFILLSPAAVPLSNGGCVGASGFIDAFALPASGTFSLELGSQTGSGSATVEAYNVVDLTTPITVGGGASLSNTVPGQNMLFTFSLSQATPISAYSTFFDGGSYSHCVYTYILNSTGQKVAYYYNSRLPCTSSSFIDKITLPAGSYTLLADPVGSATSIQVSANLYNASDATGSVTINHRAIAFSTSFAGQNLAIHFSGNAGQLATVKLTNIYDNQSCAYVNLLSTDGVTSLTSSSICYANNSPLTLQQVTLPNTGTYTIYIDPQDVYQINLNAAVTSP